MKVIKKKGISLKEKQRREEQSIPNTLYRDGNGGTFRMHKKAKNAYRIY